jgi:hypothetical protein
MRCFAQFNEPVQINDQNVANIAGESSYKVVGENIYITYLESWLSSSPLEYRTIFKFSEDNGQNFVTTIIDSIMFGRWINPVLEVLSDGTIIVIYSRGDFYKAISVDNGNSFQIDFLTSGSYKPVYTTNQNDIIYIAVENCFYEGLEIRNDTFQIENILPATIRDISKIEQNGIRPFPSDAEIVYVKIDGNNYSSMIGNIEYIGDSLFIVYNSYPDAAHPDFPIGDSIWVNEVAIYDTIWTAGPSGTLNNQSVWVECVLWIEGMVSGLQSWGCPENIYITNDLYYENTEIGANPDDLFNMNLTDFIGLYSEDRILIKYKHFDPFINEITVPNCDGDVYVYGVLIAWGYDPGHINLNTGFVSFEYQHPHGSTPDFWWSNPSTGEEELLTYIDLHKYIFNPTEPVPAELEPFVLHGNNPPAGFPACGFPYESPNYFQPNIPPYGTDYPWYNPVWPESSEDIVYERGTFHFYGAMAQRRRGFIHRSGTDPYNHPSNHEWDIENHHYDGVHSSTGYVKDYYFDRRILFQSLVDISIVNKPITDSYKILRSIDNGNSFTILDEQALNEASHNLQMCANDSLLVVAYHESGDPLINLKLYDENGSIGEDSMDLSGYPTIIDPQLLNIELTDVLYIHISNSDYLYFNNEDEFIIKYNMENNEIENITSFEPDYNLTNFNISNDELKIFITCEMFNDELNPEPLTLHFNYSNDNNWNDVYNYETNFVNFVPYSSKIALNFNESDSLSFLINVTDSLYSFGNLFLLTGSIDFSTEYSEEEIIRPGYNLQSYPNPFNPETTIRFTTENTEKNTELIIYNIKGQKVKRLVSDRISAGEHSVVWNGKDSNNKSVASGIYFYKLSADKETAMKKMLLLK